MPSLWGHFTITLGSLCPHQRVTLPSPKGHFALTKGSFWEFLSKTQKRPNTEPQGVLECVKYRFLKRKMRSITWKGPQLGMPGSTPRHARIHTSACHLHTAACPSWVVVEGWPSWHTPRGYLFQAFSIPNTYFAHPGGSGDAPRGDGDGRFCKAKAFNSIPTRIGRDDKVTPK